MGVEGESDYNILIYIIFTYLAVPSQSYLDFNYHYLCGNLLFCCYNILMILWLKI